MMVERHWKGLAIREKAGHYVQHLKEETLPALKKIPGFKGFTILSQETKEGTAFLIITRWEKLESIRLFAGANYEEAVVPDVVKAMMIRYDLRAEHYVVQWDETF
jgi:heme-degrading monooxygenase HmoA